MFKIGGIQKTTLLDFPGKIAAIVFAQGCNFRCGYCHNPELLKFKEYSEFSNEAFFDFLKNRVGKLDGVVITGGEPTLQPELYDFISKIKISGFSVKLDTNGTNPDILEKLINGNRLDYIAMDIKSPIEKYNDITCAKVKKENILKSIDLIMKSNIDYEFRTTVLKSQLSFEDFDQIGELIKGAKCYYLQKFNPSKIYNPALTDEITYSDTEFQNICKKLQNKIETVEYR